MFRISAEVLSASGAGLTIGPAAAVATDFALETTVLPRKSLVFLLPKLTIFVRSGLQGLYPARDCCGCVISALRAQVVIAEGHEPWV